MIFVTSLDMLDKTVLEVTPARLVTLLPDEEPVPTPPDLSPDKHLTVAINDITEPTEGLIAPGQDHIEELIGFIRAWQDGVAAGDEEPRILFHCRMGISRSGAAAYIALCMVSEPGREQDIALAMRAAGAHLQPNILMVQIADDILGRDGRMAEAINALGLGSGYNRTDWVELSPPDAP